MSSTYTEKAYAKVNLNLEIIGCRPDGYHELVSLVAFARDVFDVITVTPAECLSLHICGPSSQYIDGSNIVSLAAEAASKVPAVTQLGHTELIKNLPVAAGLGGGSADAAAVLRALGRLNGISDIETAFANLCPALGADVPVCLQSGTAEGALMWGIGEHVWRLHAADENHQLFPKGLSAVLANPGVPVPTGDIFRALDAAPLETSPASPEKPGPFQTIDALVEFLNNSLNDLEKPAFSIAPEIENVLDELRNLPCCRLARMSGSGATCFGLFKSFAQAEVAALQLINQRPQWWIAATRLS